jgi:hypothetical protein
MGGGARVGEKEGGGSRVSMGGVELRTHRGGQRCARAWPRSADGHRPSSHS